MTSLWNSEPSGCTGGSDQFYPVLMLEHHNPWTPYWSPNNTHPPCSCSISSPSGYLSVSLSWRLYVCTWHPGSGKADRLLWLEVRWINASALLWCRACFPIACLWLIKHIDWPVRRHEGWPTAALHGTTSPPSLSLSWRLKGKGNTSCKVMSARWIWQHRKAPLHLLCFPSSCHGTVLLRGYVHLFFSISPLHLLQPSPTCNTKQPHYPWQ